MEYSGWGMALTNSPKLVPPFNNSSVLLGFKLQLLPWMKGFKFYVHVTPCIMTNSL
jgi:hypothetical protein